MDARDDATLTDITATAMENLLSHADEAVRVQAQTLLEGVDRLHREALVRLEALLMRSGLLGEALEDAWVAQVFELYDLGASDERGTVENALAEVRRYIEGHGGHLEILGVQAGVVRLRLKGTCTRCAASSVTLHQGVEEVLRQAWPGFVGLDVVPADSGAGAPKPPRFVDALSLEDIGEGRTVLLEGREVLVRRSGAQIHATPAEGDGVASFPAVVVDGRVQVAVDVPASVPPTGAAP